MMVENQKTVRTIFFNRAIQTAENYRDICFESCVKTRKLPLECPKRKQNMII